MVETRAGHIHSVMVGKGQEVCLRNNDTEVCVGFLVHVTDVGDRRFIRYAVVRHVGESFEGSKPWDGRIHVSKKAAQAHLEEVLGRKVDDTAFVTKTKMPPINKKSSFHFPADDIFSELEMSDTPFSKN